MDPVDDEVGGPKGLVDGVDAHDRGIVAYPCVPGGRKWSVGKYGPGRRLEPLPQPVDGVKFVDLSGPT